MSSRHDARPRSLTPSIETEGPVEVCALNKDSPTARLSVRYNSTGYLWEQASSLSAYVSINNAGDTFGPFIANPYSNLPTDASIVIGEIRDLHWCYHGTKSESSTDVPAYGSMYGRCPMNEQFPLLDGDVGKGYFGYFYNPAPVNELALVSQKTMWEIQVAFVNGKGNWDSKFGYNYRFSL
ncbi:hypothetical protein HDU67_007810 [Dinochytrium kinnereticum]|nr:hypothetical protein HDU67_007810 [Dinochytrium kinnereticum]